MQANDILREMVRRRGLSVRKASEAIGRSSSYVGRMIAAHSAQSTGILAEIGSKLGFDLILRDRTNGDELTVDPMSERSETSKNSEQEGLTQANDVLREMIGRRGLSQNGASDVLGRSKSYVSKMLSVHSVPNTKLLAEFGDKLDFDLILRDRETKDEILIDPPTED